MFERILVAIDTSIGDRHVFDTALSLAQLTQARLLLAHVLSDLAIMRETNRLRPENLEGHSPGEDERLRASNEPLRGDTSGLEMLRQFHAIAKASGVGADIAQPLANPGDKICNLAIDWGADLIVMGRRESTDLQASGQGSVSDHVVCHTTCPVLVIQHQKFDETNQYYGQVAMHYS